MSQNKANHLPKIAGGVALAATFAIAGYHLRDAGAQSAKAVAQAPAPVVKTPAVQSAAQMQTAFAEVARVAEPAVVTITTAKRAAASDSRLNDLRRFGVPSPGGNGDDLDEFLRRFRGFEPNSYKGDTSLNPADGFRTIQAQSRPNGGYVDTGVGSGIIYDKSGLILTNAHVVADADRVTVKLLDGRTFKDAKVLGSDERTDVAVVKIPVTDAPAVTLGDSSKVQVGDWAIAVGNPYGLSNTLTVGVISASAREVNLAANGSLNDYLQTDASINPGNSGGALLDIYGRVIGINNAIYSRSGGNVGIGFAIPINVARTVAADLVKNGRVRRALIGVQMSSIDETNAAAFGLPTGTKGVIVQNVVPNSPALRAGVKVGDIITAWNGETITRDTDLQRKVAASPIGKAGTLTVTRGGETVTLSVTPEETPEKTVASAPDAAPNAPVQSKLGVALAPLSPQTRTQYKIADTVRAGVVVTDVADGSPASSAGITPGDVITRAGQTVVNAPGDVDRAKEALLKAQTGDSKSVALYVVKPSGESAFVVLQVGE